MTEHLPETLSDALRHRRLRAVAATLSIELQECRVEAAGAASDSMRSWFDGRSQGIERALLLLDDVLEARDVPRR